MEQNTGFSYFLTKKELKNLYSYLLTTTGWLCLNFCYTHDEKNNYYLIHDIKRHFFYLRIENLFKF